jgi:hypothetical protein
MLNKLIKELKNNNYKIIKKENDTIEILSPTFYTLIFVTYDLKYMITFINYEGEILGYNTHSTIENVMEYIKLAKEKLK